MNAIRTACSSVSRGSLQSLRLAMRRETVHPTPASVAATPYFQMQANGPDGEAILILAHVADGELGWYGAGRDAVFTRDGLVVKTVGLPQDLEETTIPAGNPFHDGLQHLSAPVTYARQVDWSPGYRYGIALTATLEPKAIEDVDILGTIHRLRRIDEHGAACHRAEAGTRHCGSVTGTEAMPEQVFSGGTSADVADADDQ